MCYLLQAKLWLVLIIDMYVHESGSCWALPWLVGPTSIDELEHQQLAFFKDQKPQKSALRCTGALDLRVWLLTWTWPIYYFVWKYQPKPQSFGSGWWAEVQIYPVVLVSDQVHRLITWFAFFFFFSHWMEILFLNGSNPRRVGPKCISLSWAWPYKVARVIK